MNGIILTLDHSSDKSLYVQIYGELKKRILDGDLPEGTRLPSLRSFAEENQVSLTTVQNAYDQLAVEGYVESRDRSGYYVAGNIAEAASGVRPQGSGEESGLEEILSWDGRRAYSEYASTGPQTLFHDEEGFDFSKWKKCMNRVFNEYPHLLQTEADVQGEPSLRYEIAKYLYTSRGVKCGPEQIVIGAGSQSLATHLVRVLRARDIRHAATEYPGYGPIREIFSDEGFNISDVSVNDVGITIEKLPTNLRSVVYVSPSNQFPTGAVMPIRRRYELLRWASENDSYILEDDYDSELRYTGQPIPALKSLDSEDRVIYMGSFSATLFAAIKINYMVLPADLIEVFNTIKDRYSQTCSKAEQICLALYMEDGYFYRHIKKCRKANADKLEHTIGLFEANGGEDFQALDSKSGLGLMLRVRSSLTPAKLCEIGRSLGLAMVPIDEMSTDNEKVLFFYYYRVSASLLRILVKMYVANVRRAEADRARHW